MIKSIEKFLEFNGKRISVLCADGTWWVAIRPICEALRVDYHAQYKNLQQDEILAGVLSKQTTHDASNRLQEMVCIPERYIYGWLFSVRSDSSDLKKYKLKCYDVLYNHFHGTITGRMNALTEKTSTELEIIELEEKLKAQLLESEEYTKIQELKKKHKNISKTLKDLDLELLAGQLSLKL
jgi:prophage antirepressor-like protein